MPGPLPLILEQDPIPEPLHGVNPRSIMGRAAWDALRREVYAKHGYRCAACGVRSRDAMFRKYLEAHESYEIDYKRRQMRLDSIEPLCNACHGFVHTKLLGTKLRSGKLSRADAASIARHCTGVLAEAGGRLSFVGAHFCRAVGVRHDLEVKRAPGRLVWPGWKLVWGGKEYPSPYATPEEWRDAMRKR